MRSRPDTIYIDLSGPEGNVYQLGGLSRGWARQIGIEPPNITKDASVYTDVLDNFDKAWKGKVGYVFLYDPREQQEDEDDED